MDDGDCLVHIYTLGGSQRGPSLRLRYSDVEALRSEYLSEQCLHVRDVSSPLGSDDGASDSGYASSRTSRIDSKQCELYIPAPATLTRKQAYNYHITTRNFFAYATSKPVVGEKLGPALLDLLQRMREWQPKTAALANFTAYCQSQGYLDVARNTDYALACLTLAEEARLKELWVEAFVHCVGMHEQLDRSHEYETLNNTTKALISRASLEMDLHISRVTRALGSFLEEELGPEHLGLPKAARDHLDRFRSFLHNYYVDKLGYFPPDEEGPWNKRLWTKMYHAFQTLYEYLVDNESETGPMNGRGATGGVCVVQNVQAFDQRHGYAPLPHPLPLLPQVPEQRRTVEQQKGLRNFKLGRVDTVTEAQVSTKQALAKAANHGVQKAMGCELVEEYKRFERQKLEEKLSAAEARKVRWLLIYSALQMLISITRAPKEVRDTDSPTYPLCVLTTGCPSWVDDNASEPRTPRAAVTTTQVSLAPPPTNETEDRISIHPDCEADNAEDYFSGHGLSRQASALSLQMTTPPPLRITTQISRTASIRSSVHSGVHALHRSFVGSLARRTSTRKASDPIRPLSKTSSFCEIVVEGYGNGIDGEERRRASLASLESQKAESSSLAAFDFGLNDVSEEPMLEDYHVDHLLDASPIANDDAEIGRRLSNSSLSAVASDISGSSRSSACLNITDSPATELSGWDSDESKRNSEIKAANSAIDLLADKTTRPSASKRHSYKQKELNFGLYGVRSQCYSVSAGCYTPTGLISLPMSKFHSQRPRSVESEKSDASWTTPGAGLQTVESDESEEMRGRRMSRGLGRLPSEGIVSC